MARQVTMTVPVNSQVVRIWPTEVAHGRFLIVVSYEIERDHGMRLWRMTQLAALGRFLRASLCRDGFWPESKDLMVTLGEHQSLFAEDSHFATPLPGYSSAWGARRFEDAACVAVRRVLKAIAPSAPAKQYLAEFERLGRTFSWSYRVASPSAAAELKLSLTRDRFKARLSVTTRMGTRDFPVFRSGASSSEWVHLLGRMRITNRQVVIAAVSGMFVRIVRKGREAARWTGRGASLEQFIVALGPPVTGIVQKFELKRARPNKAQ